MIREIESVSIPLSNINQSLVRILKVKEKIKVLGNSNLDFENILEENQCLSKEMQTFFKK